MRNVDDEYNVDETNIFDILNGFKSTHPTRHGK